MDVMIYLNGGLSKHNAFTFSLIKKASSLTNTIAILPAFCDPGDFVLNGGYNLIASSLAENDTISTFIDQSISFPILGEGWAAAVFVNDEDSTIGLNVNALCFDNPPLR